MMLQNTIGNDLTLRCISSGPDTVTLCQHAPGTACPDGLVEGSVMALQKSAEILDRGMRSWHSTLVAVAWMTTHDICAASMSVVGPQPAPSHALRAAGNLLGGSCMLGGMALEIATDAAYPLYRRVDLTVERMVRTA